jgi:hypothetical protein
MTPLVIAMEPRTALEAMVHLEMAGDESIRPALRTRLDTRPELWLGIGTLADRVRQAWLQRLEGTDLVTQEMCTP